MPAEDLDAELARAQIATADAQRLAVRRADLDRLSLLVLAAIQVVFAVIVVILGSRATMFGLGLWLIPGFLMVLFTAWRERHERAFTRSGKRIQWAAFGTYAVWTGLLLLWISPRIGWQTRPPDWRFVVIAAVSVIPLLLGAWLIGRVRWE